LKSAEVCRNNAKAVDENAAEVLYADDTPGVYKMSMVRMVILTDKYPNVRVYIVIRQKWRSCKFTAYVRLSKIVRYEKPYNVTGIIS
jgi:hypothetical protein